MKNLLQPPLTFRSFQRLLAREFKCSIDDAIQRSMYSICFGCSSIALENCKRTKYDSTLQEDKLLEIWRSITPGVVLDKIDIPTMPARQVMVLLKELKYLSVDLLRQIPEFENCMEEKCWFSISDNQLSLSSEVWVDLVLEYFPVDLPYEPAIKLCHLLRRYPRYQIQATQVALLIEQVEIAEEVLSNSGTSMLSKLKLQELKSISDKLDSFKPIQNPQLLFNCACCHFLLGDVSSSREYFRRLVENIKVYSKDQLTDVLSENESAAFFAGVMLYARFTDTSIKDSLLCEYETDKAVSLSTMATFLKAYNISQAGNLDRLIKVLRAGLLRCVSLNEFSMYVLFALMYFWNLLLACRVQEAQAFSQEARSFLLQNKVAFPGAHEWLRSMELLYLRLEGNISELDAKVKSRLDIKFFSSDPLRRLYLEILLAETTLIKHSTIDSDIDFDKLIEKQNAYFHPTYWLPSATDLHMMSTALTDKSLKVRISEEEANLYIGVSAQTHLLCKIKVLLFQHRISGLPVILDKFIEELTRSSQWLRRHEVLVLKSVVLFHNGNHTNALRLFSRTVENLMEKKLLGALLDPFIVWRVFLEQETEFPGRRELQNMLNKVGLTDLGVKYTNRLTLLTALSSREKQVIKLLAKGLKNKDIALILNLSPSTVRTHLQNIYSKFEVNNRSAAIIAAYQHGILSPADIASDCVAEEESP